MYVRSLQISLGVCVCFLLGGVGKIDFIYFILKIWLLKVSMKSN